MRDFDFDKQFKRNSTIFNVLFTITVVGIVCVFGFYAFIAYKTVEVVQNPGFAQQTGQFIGKILKGIDEGKK